MSQSFTSFAVSPYVGSPYGQPIRLCSTPQSQAKTLRIDIPWTAYGASPSNQDIGVSINLIAQGATTPALNEIRSVYIDNTFSPVPVYVQFPDTLFTVVCPAYGVVMSPVFTNVQNVNVYAQGFSTGQAPTTSFFFSNIDRQGYYIPTADGGSQIIPVILLYTETRLNTDLGNYNLLTVDLGPADTDRIIVVAANESINPGTNIQMSGLTIGGIAATKITSVARLSAPNQYHSSIWQAAVPTGVNATVNVVFPAAASFRRTQLNFYSVRNLSNPVALDSDATLANSVTLDTGANGVIIGAQCFGQAPNSILNMSQDFVGICDTSGANALARSMSYLSTENTTRNVGYNNCFTFAAASWN